MDDFASRFGAARQQHDAAERVRAEAEQQRALEQQGHERALAQGAPGIAAALTAKGVPPDLRISQRVRTTSRRMFKEVVTESVTDVAEGWAFSLRAHEFKDPDTQRADPYTFNVSGYLLTATGVVHSVRISGYGHLPRRNGVLELIHTDFVPWGSPGTTNGPVPFEHNGLAKPMVDGLIELALRYGVTPA
ncbi:hypothetical protein AB0K00_32360 [Dactylosporangium sp. NPDC049525]|uniref:hypothetical protein n=1 Tax=Dactylosporangium sp. NPDC049525 TaxID=3154730 RepID=UPI0034248F42